MADIKKMAFAGSWYPADSDACIRSISGFLKDRPEPAKGRFKGGIVPHAGWIYSGSIACRVIASLRGAQPVDTVILFGGHMHPDSDPLLLSHGSVQTPLGEIRVADDITREIADVTGAKQIPPDRFPDENTLELQYPFIKHFFPHARIVVCCVPLSGQAKVIGNEACRAARTVSAQFKIIGSTDMTHYGPDFNFTPAGTGVKAVEWVKTVNDRHAIEALVDMDAEQIVNQGVAHRNMCCAGAAAAAASACKANGAVSGVSLDYATSYEKSAGLSFVGYSGILYS